MKDTINMSGELQLAVIKGKKQKVTNSISSELKNVMASAMQSAQTFSLNGSKFSTDNFASPTAGENGIVVFDSGSNYYETKMTSVTGNTSANTVTLVSSTRANGTSYTFTGAKCGHGYSSGDFDYLMASTTFSQAVNDGQQLDLTWTITIG